jgi:predicted RNase H-like nuclease (RuvC/YqgF family)
MEIYKNTKELIKKYEDVVEQLNKENKRLQVSLKDMVQTNRNLRDQV